MSKPKGWRETSIRELGGPGAVQTGPFGAELHADDYVASGVPLVLIRNIGNGEVHEAGPSPDHQIRCTTSLKLFA